MKRISHWIDGKVVEGTSGRSATVWQPATGEAQATVDLASVAEVDHVVAVAKQAFAGWRSTNLSRRAEVMFNLRELIAANRKEIASLLSAEHGKVLSDALGEVSRGLENIEFACGVPHLLKGSFSEQASTGVDVYNIRQPLGVVAGITPFNFPAMVPMWMFANALACGNTFVLKPSEKDPSSAMFLAELLKQAIEGRGDRWQRAEMLNELHARRLRLGIIDRVASLVRHGHRTLRARVVGEHLHLPRRESAFEIIDDIFAGREVDLELGALVGAKRIEAAVENRFSRGHQLQYDRLTVRQMVAHRGDHRRELHRQQH
ncbi:MAG TPA: aldehyde dehydrogenase family protein, partial [Ilumatobacteraceae bacterium]|nr:aldehyde dehydrogenase family protein [Ilumatobacteraceae bacterium]